MVTSFALHVMGMIFMLMDHMWATLFPYAEWLTCVGRLAFPIFAFMIVEGYFHTSDIKKYMKRMLFFALLSEIPFDFLYASTPFYPFHQNVLWTFLLALLLMAWMDKIKMQEKMWIKVLGCAGVTLLGFLLGTITMVDYYGTGILTVLIFYHFRGNKWWCRLGQLVCLYYIHVNILGGYYYNVDLFGHHFEVVQQGLALLALIPIWLYNGKQGYHKRWFQYFCYAFYPVHLLLLYIVWTFVN